MVDESLRFFGAKKSISRDPQELLRWRTSSNHIDANHLMQSSQGWMCLPRCIDGIVCCTFVRKNSHAMVCNRHQGNRRCERQKLIRRHGSGRRFLDSTTAGILLIFSCLFMRRATTTFFGAACCRGSLGKSTSRGTGDHDHQKQTQGLTELFHSY